MNVSQLTLATTIFLAACLLGCAPIPVEGRYSYESNTDFSKFRSFAFADLSDDIFSTPESTARFRTAMVSALSAKGFTENPENPDFLIMAAPVSTYREMYALAGNIEIPKAMLRVSFRRPSGGLNIYEGAAYAYYEHTWSQEEKNSTVDEAVRVIVAKFPPGK
jgi:hypothetical protein